MESRQIDLLNLGLIVLSLLAAFALPFQVFLFSYAVLGPLHYITEINWLDERKYFSQSRYTPWVLGSIVLLACLFTFYREGERQVLFVGFKQVIDAIVSQGVIAFATQHFAHFMFIAFVAAMALTAFKDKWYRGMVVLMGLGIAMLFHGNATYKLLIGTMLPTILHVSIFTGLFMLYGAMKSNSRPGFAAVGLFILAQVLIFYFPVTPEHYFLALSGSTNDTMTQSGFNNILGQIGGFFGKAGQGSVFVLNSELGVRLGIYFAFIYTYHYLNWFSKTSIIGWHKVPKKKLIGGLGLWIASMALYAYNYRLGLLALLFLSLMHVVLEFPLNYLSVRGILSGVFRHPGKMGEN
jgi:hypothetical protein